MLCLLESVHQPSWLLRYRDFCFRGVFAKHWHWNTKISASSELYNYYTIVDLHYAFIEFFQLFPPVSHIINFIELQLWCLKQKLKLLSRVEPGVNLYFKFLTVLLLLLLLLLTLTPFSSIFIFFWNIRKKQSYIHGDAKQECFRDMGKTITQCILHIASTQSTVVWLVDVTDPLTLCVCVCVLASCACMSARPRFLSVCITCLHELQGRGRKQLSRLQLEKELPVIYLYSGHLCPERLTLLPAHHSYCLVVNCI